MFILRTFRGTGNKIQKIIYSDLYEYWKDVLFTEIPLLRKHKEGGLQKLKQEGWYCKWEVYLREEFFSICFLNVLRFSKRKYRQKNRLDPKPKRKNLIPTKNATAWNILEAKSVRKITHNDFLQSAAITIPFDAYQNLPYLLWVNFCPTKVDSRNLISKTRCSII